MPSDKSSARSSGALSVSQPKRVTNVASGHATLYRSANIHCFTVDIVPTGNRVIFGYLSIGAIHPHHWLHIGTTYEVAERERERERFKI